MAPLDGTPFNDVEIQPHGSIVLFVPHTADGEEWIEDNVAQENQTWICGGLVCEARFASELAVGMARDGILLCLRKSDDSLVNLEYIEA